MKKQSGFTLIELMVVMAIIAILATAGLTAYSNYLKKARDSARAQTARQLMTKVEELANGGLVPTVDELKNFLIAENFASTTNSTISNNPLLNLDPLNGAAQCPTTLCGFLYVTLTGNRYLIGYSVEHNDSVEGSLLVDTTQGLWSYIDGPDGVEDVTGQYWWGNFIGTLSDTERTSWYLDDWNPARVLEQQFISFYGDYTP